MIGDKLVIEAHHTDRAAEICDLVAGRIGPGGRFTLTVAGESGAGQSPAGPEAEAVGSHCLIPFYQEGLGRASFSKWVREWPNRP